MFAKLKFSLEKWCKGEFDIGKNECVCNKFPT